MTQEEISELTDAVLHKLAAMAVRDAVTIAPTDEWYFNHFLPTAMDRHALIVASSLEMIVCFGDKVVLVTEPKGGQSRTVSYGEGTIYSRLSAMRRAITLLAADCAQYI
ncbi:hypothetical protein [Pantoea stewartii]|uniref:hypothetical protein n=1 Tax=Pantoea stewartii TaxID=66269 RepID=UPI0025A1ABDE|nr:hypothetical protein [Pantoea stewartii]